MHCPDYRDADFQFSDGTTPHEFDIGTGRHRITAGVGIRF